jgi:epimerase transport system membrane fusion protein
MRERLVGEKAEHQANIAGVTVQIGEAKLQVLQLQKERRSEVVAQLTETLAKLQDVKERATAVSDRVDRSLIVAPVDGIVLGLGYHTVGGVVAPGNRILDIVPEGAGLLVEAQVSPADIDRVSVGMIADIRFSTFNSSTPVMEGKVIALSAGSLNREDGSSYYLAKVELTDSGQDILDEKKLILVPGMPAEVLINTGARTLLEYLVQPATNAIARSMIEE